MKYALIIGNDRYTDQKLARLKAPVADVRALATVLSDQSIGFFDNVIPLINKTESQVSRAISNFFTNKKPEDLVLVYFSGHGVLDGRGRLFLALKDTQTSLLKSTAIPAAFISDEMDSCRSRRQILILDCCNSGAFERGAKGEQKAVTEATFEGNGFGRVVLTASDSTQFALEGEQIVQTELSLFTHFLLAGLKTGEADLNNDGYVSLDEWYDYTYTQVLATTPKQNPNKWSYRQQGDLIIAKNPSWKKKIAGLPTKLSDLLESPYSGVREVAIRELGLLLRSNDSELTELAHQALEKLKEDNSQTVSLAAENMLLDVGLAKETREKEEREAAEKTAQEKLEREAAEKAAQEKANRKTAEKAKRERAERRTAQIMVLKEILSKSFASLKSTLSKILPFLRIAVLAGIVIVAMWIALPGISNSFSFFSDEKPTTTVTFTSSPSISTKTPTMSPTLTLSPTKTNTPTLTPTVTPIPRSSILFQRTFEDGALGVWSHQGGDWVIEQEQDGNDYLSGSSSSIQPQIQYTYQNTRWTDYALETRVKFIKGHTLSILIRSNVGSGEHYEVAIKDFGISFNRFMQTWSMIGEPNSRKLDLNRWFTIRVEIQGDLLSLYIDNALVQDLKLQPPLVNYGGIGFVLDVGSEVYFDDIRAWSLK